MAEFEKVVKASVSNAEIKKAKEILASCKLQSVSLEGAALEKGTASCQGSSPSDCYSLSFQISGESANIPRGNCSCPVGHRAKNGLCKHVVALLLWRAKELGKVHLAASKTNVEKEKEVEQLKTVDSRHVATRSEPATPCTVSAWVGTSSKRALPSWMAGVAGASVKGGHPTEVKPRRKVDGSMLARPPPPTRRTRRSSVKPLTLSRDSDEDPGEVEDGGDDETADIENADEVVVEPTIIPKASKGEAAREARIARTLRTESKCNERKVSKEGPKLQSARSKRAARETSRRNNDENESNSEEEKLAPKKRARRARKTLVESDLSDDADDRSGVGVTEACGELGFTAADLVVLARKHLEGEKIPKQLQTLENKPPSRISENVATSSKPLSIYSINKWKQLSSDVDPRSTDCSEEGANDTVKLNSFDVENDDSFEAKYSQLQDKVVGAVIKDTEKLGSLDVENEDFFKADKVVEDADIGDTLPLNSFDVEKSFEVEYSHDKDKEKQSSPGHEQSYIKGLEDTSMEADAVANDMLELMFGSRITQVDNKSSASNSSVSHLQEGDKVNCAGSLDIYIEKKCSASKSSVNDVQGLDKVNNTAAASDANDFFVGAKAKKKSSLKDKVKMFLT